METAGEVEEKWEKKFGSLRWDFTMLENLYVFPLLSNQQQAIEMYAIQRPLMDITDLYQEIAQKIRSSDELLDSHLDRKQSKQALCLNWIAGLGFFFSLALAVEQVWLGAAEDWDNRWGWRAVAMLLFVAVLVLSGVLWRKAFKPCARPTRK
jgi:hypothetical protein